MTLITDINILRKLGDFVGGAPTITQRILLMRSDDSIYEYDNSEIAAGDRVYEYARENFNSTAYLLKSKVADPKYTAEEWLDLQGIGGARQPTLLYLRQSLAASGQTSEELDALEGYLRLILAMYAADPAPKSDWPVCPVAFDDVVSATMRALEPTAFSA